MIAPLSNPEDVEQQNESIIMKIGYIGIGIMGLPQYVKISETITLIL